jgi:protocatechuate 3,4-dioxygenase beta subunit
MSTPHDPHDLGLAADLDTLIRQTANRRRALRWLLAGGAAGSGLVACGGGGGSAGTIGFNGSENTSLGTSSTTTSSGTCSVIPEETAGPYPGDGSNTSGGSIANALALSGIVRSDIRSSIAGASGTASGVPLTVNLQLVNTNASCGTLEGYAVYLWHCDAQGRYSMYSSGVTGENWLRGVQASDASGIVTFSTIVPGCYSGRWPHIHFEVYRSTTTATSWSNKLKTSQLALPEAVCDAVYADTSAYPSSAANLAHLSLATDNIFSDGYSTQLAVVTGSVSAGYVAALQVGISV